MATEELFKFLGTSTMLAQRFDAAARGFIGAKVQNLNYLANMVANRTDKLMSLTLYYQLKRDCYFVLTRDRLTCVNVI